LVEARAAALGVAERAVLEAGGRSHELPGGRIRIEIALDGEPGGAAEVLRAAARAVLAPRRAPRLMGVLNLSPDSFSDGAAARTPEAALDCALAMVEAGAELIDVGGESTRPGAQPVSAAEERRRVEAVVHLLAAHLAVDVGIDTRKAEVARAALDAGARYVNDVSAGAHDPAMLATVAARDCGYVAMHMRGEPATMQGEARYGDVVADVCEELRGAVRRALDAGVRRENLLVDPGIGFAKLPEHSLALLARLAELRSLALPIVLGVSRKSFLGAVSGEHEPARRAHETSAAIAAGVLGGAEILRVHDVDAARRAAQVADAVARARSV
jgi:dihydropteroate synthase